MKTEKRLEFIDSLNPNKQHQNNNAYTPNSKEDRLRSISMTKVQTPSEFDVLFNQVVQNQQKKLLEERTPNVIEYSDVIKDSRFDDIDKDLGFKT